MRLIPWLAMQQLLDSALPIGGFSHSFGLETMVQEKRISTADQLERYAETMLLQSWATGDALVVKALYEAAEEGGDWERAWRIERLVHIQRIGSESRAGTEKMGKRLLQLAAAMHPQLDWEPLQAAYRAGACLATHSLVHGFVCLRLGMPLEQAVQGYFYACIVTCVGSALRLMSMGQTEGQAMIARLAALTEEGWRIADSLMPEDAYGNVPMADIMMIRHETLYSRLFMS
ncbi:urease accessory protein UreF [Paenibacillus darwinianus]|uniref:Urease accessory protein UreF n=1 Tax=Paenibacillus darwinianus TaxID=1380763 RepID=A0A9W5W6H0_9BACL|nr:urease accessory UreF family protein [Paenibacillus darwinianus]EXX84844.1 urease accessory protein UreF [Paenibacillus darwinianus]EXX85467.1 urease accessory protein UreF [Paenibacillus darwinianus]EXX85658.1 urease accessory protein UreF [Paenibacillus darwinianus]